MRKTRHGPAHLMLRDGRGLTKSREEAARTEGGPAHRSGSENEDGVGQGRLAEGQPCRQCRPP